MNLAVLTGRLTKDVDVRRNNDTCVARYTLAVDRKFKKEGMPDADFISCVAFNKSGDFAEKYLKKGMKITVIGEIRTGKYTSKEGHTVYTTDVVVNEHEFVESKKDSQEEPQSSDDGYMNIPEGIEQDLPFK